MGARDAVTATGTAILHKFRRFFAGAKKHLSRLAPRPDAISLPPSLSAASSRAAHNLRVFRVTYAVVAWVILLVSLSPHHKASMMFLMAASKGALAYGLLLKAFPDSALLRRVLNAKLVAVVFLCVVVAELVTTSAVDCLVEALGIAGAVVLLHAVLRVKDDGEDMDVVIGGEHDEKVEVEVVEVEKEEKLIKEKDADTDLETGQAS